MKKIFILLIALLCSVHLIADNYRIASMNVPSVVIGGKKCTVGSVFSDKDVIVWTKANEEIWVINTDSGKKLLISRSLFENKKINNIKDFYVKINTPGTMSGGEPDWTLIRAQKDFGEKRKALVIGNSNYLIENTLRAPSSDAIKVANKLSALGFDVYLMLDSRKSDMDQATKIFTDRASNAEIVMFYYIGHGQQIAGETYLLPVESTVRRESDKYSCMYGPQIVARINETNAQTKLIFLDACRSEGNYQMGATQLFSMEAPVNGIVMFSTKQGDFAFDGYNDDSTPFTKAFCNNIGLENTRIEIVLSNIVHDVTKLTSNYIEKQIPNYNNSLTHEVTLNKVSISIQHNVDRNEIIENSSDAGLQFWLKKAEQGDVDALFHLGYLYESGRGVSQDYKEAAKWYRKAAEQGNANAQCNLGVLYFCGYGVSKDYNEAAKWYRKAAEQGLASAQSNLGILYENGYGVSKDYNEAAKWYRKAAEQGLATAQCNLGKLYYYGYGVSQDYNEAVKWYRKAAEQGDAKAQLILGHLYENGLRVSQDYNEAVKWYRKAAEQGYASAQCNLGILYENGLGVSQDYNEAAKWYRKAAEQGDADAIRLLQLLESKHK